MSEMIERVARAAYDKMVRCSGSNPDEELNRWDNQLAALREDWRAAMIAAIQAMGEPTEAMVDAGGDTPMVDGDGHDPKEVWRAMIDEALK